MNWIFEEYGDNLDEEKLKKIPTKRLQEIVDDCDRAGDGTLCEICGFYQVIIEERKAKEVK